MASKNRYRVEFAIQAVSIRVLAAAAGVFSIPAATSEAAGAVQAINELLAGTTLLDNDQQGVPKAYLNYLLLDDDYKIIDQGFVQVSEAAEVKTGKQKRAKRKNAATDSASHETLSVDLNIKDNGYLYTYVSNESNWDVDVFFDNMMVMAMAAQPAVVQADDYYPFGLTHRQPFPNSEPNKYLYNGKELHTDLGLNWLDYGTRFFGCWSSEKQYKICNPGMIWSRHKLRGQPHFFQRSP